MLWKAQQRAIIVGKKRQQSIFFTHYICSIESNVHALQLKYVKNQPSGVFVSCELPALVSSFTRVTPRPHSNFFQERLETRFKMEKTAKVVYSPDRSR